VGTIVITGLRLWKDPTESNNNSPRIEIYYAQRGYNIPKREQYCQYPFNLETSTFQSRIYVKTLFL